MTMVLSGLTAWLVQRLSALYLLFFSLLVGYWLISTPQLDFSTWRALFAQPVVAITSAMFILALLLHLWVGVRDVILDYAGHFAGIRLILLALLGAWLIALGIWSTGILITGILP